MIVLYIPQVDLPTMLNADGTPVWTHDATDWQVATTPTFTPESIVVESRSDINNLTSITFDTDLDPEVTYYARARVIANKGIFEWSSVAMVKVSDFIKIAFDNPIPSAVIKPEIGLDFPEDNTPATLFTITTTPLNTPSNATHSKTIYIIEDMLGEPVYMKTTTEYLTRLFMDDVILKDGAAYILKVAHVSSSGDMSDFASKLIHVRKIDDVILTSPTDIINDSNGYSLTIAPVEYFKSMRVKFYRAGLSDAELIFETTVDRTSLIIPNSVISHGNTSYILAIEVVYENDTSSGYKYYPITIS